MHVVEPLDDAAGKLPFFTVPKGGMIFGLHGWNARFQKPSQGHGGFKLLGVTGQVFR